jgi:hypothetical protein
MAEEAEAKKNDTLVFPSKLRSQVENGTAHVRFQALDKDNIGQVLHLFIPPGFSVPDSANYGTMDLGTIIGGVENTGGIGDITEADVKAGMARAGSIVAGTTGAQVGAIAQLRAGIATNPYTETQFNNSNIRSFGFTFKLVSESEEEAETALLIEDYFRENMYPEVFGEFTLKYPNRFTIEFYSVEGMNKYMPRINECYLVSLNTAYNSTSNSFHAKGQPVEIDIAVTFQETKALTRADLSRTVKAAEGG